MSGNTVWQPRGSARSGGAYTETLATADSWEEGRSPGGRQGRSPGGRVGRQAGTCNSSVWGMVWLTESQISSLKLVFCAVFLLCGTFFYPLLCYCCLSHGCGCSLFTTKTPTMGGREGLTIQSRGGGPPRAKLIFWAPLQYSQQTVWLVIAGESAGVTNIININWLLLFDTRVWQWANVHPDKEEATRKISHPQWIRPIKEDGLVFSGSVYSFLAGMTFSVW